MSTGRHRPTRSALFYARFDTAAAVFQTFLLGVAIRRGDVPWALFNLFFVVFDLWLAHRAWRRHWRQFARNQSPTTRRESK